jgi:dTDP-4-dehydrorhamnose 3,5-epimerase
LNLLLTKIDGVLIAETNYRTDERGAFTRMFCHRELEPAIDGRHIVQVNYSKTETCGTIRGLHYQHAPHCEMKLVRCIKGRVWDVVVDLRAGSHTFMQWHAEELSQLNARMVIIPEGCAHGFQTLEAESELLYLHTEYYTPDAEEGVSYNDPLLNISWYLPVTEISVRDQGHLFLPQNFSGIKV